MRVITGLARGKRLNTQKGESVRPTPERVKEALFSALQFQIEGRRVLDLFAGSGQLGIESLSRGARQAVFVDASKGLRCYCAGEFGAYGLYRSCACQEDGLFNVFSGEQRTF